MEGLFNRGMVAIELFLESNVGGVEPFYHLTRQNINH
jgi:hypothetical protein